MIQLGLDTSTEWLCLAAYSATEDRVLAARQIRAERRHAQLIVPALRALLAQLGLGFDSVTAICAGTGPGSYTGLRVGLAAAQGLATGLGVTLSGGDSLEAAAWARLQPEQRGWLTMDARRGNVYAGLYRRDARTVQCLAEPVKLPLEELKKRAAASQTPLLPAGAPSASWLARTANSGRPAEARYL